MSASKKKKNNKKKKKNNNSNYKNNNKKNNIKNVSEEVKKDVVAEPTIELNIADKIIQAEEKKSEVKEIKKEESEVDKKEEKEEKKEDLVQEKAAKLKEEKKENKTQDTIKEFEDVEGKNVANIFSEAKYENVYDDCPIGPHSFYDFTNLNTDYDKPFRNYVRKHFNINANFNHIHISLPNHLKFYDDKTGNYYYPESYNMVSLLVQYIFLKIGERFSYIQGFTIDVPRLRLV